MRSILFAVVVLVIVCAAVAAVWGMVGRNERIVQPIAFNHAIHLDNAGIGCAECHTDAQSSIHAGLPGKEICLDCHDIDEEADSHPEKAKLVPFADGDEEIPWVRVAVTKPDIFFSHRRHVASGELDCLQCHADQTTLSAPPSTARLVMTMNECIACHETSSASNDCLACHR